MDIAQILLNLPKRAIWAFINDTDRKIWVSHSRNVLRAFMHNLALIKNNLHQDTGLNVDQSKIRFLILEDCEESVPKEDEFLLREAYWMEDYKKQGYTLYRDRTPLELTLRIESDRLFEEYKLVIVAKLIDRNDKQRIVGVFDKESEALVWTKKFYPGPIHEIHYCKNELTKRYLSLNSL